ncbi:MAG: AAA family ATPase [Blastocatellia bacterium]
MSNDSLVLPNLTTDYLYDADKVSERFVGRLEELAKLNNWLTLSFAGQGKPVFIIGDPGIGKTELVNQFFAKLPEKEQVVIDGRYFDVGSSAPYKIFIDGLYRTKNLLEKQYPNNAALQAFENHLKEITSISFTLSLDTNTEATKYHNFELLAKSYLLLSQIIPVVFFLDDLQWGDELSLEFIAYLIRAMQSKPFFLVCTIREYELSIEGNPLRTWLRRMSRYNAYEQIKLRSLSEADTENLINRIFPQHNFPESVTSKLHQETGGNPYYLLEVIKQLIEDKKIRWTGKLWEVDNLSEVQLPTSLIDLIELQLSRLSKNVLSIFQQAAVIGEEFSFDILHQTTELTEQELVLAIEEGLRQFLIHEEPPSILNNSEKYTFCYNTTRKVLYEKSSLRQRRIIHNKTAKILENTNAVDHNAGSIAYHYLQANELAQAFHWSVEAAAMACNKFAFDRAKTFFSWGSKALELLKNQSQNPSAESQIKYYYIYGQFHTAMAEYETARESLKKAQTICQETKATTKEAEILISLGNCLKNDSLLNEALECYQEALRLAKEHLKLKWLAASAMANCEIELNHPENALPLLKTVLETLNELIKQAIDTEKESLEKSFNETKILLEEIIKKVSKKPANKKSIEFPAIPVSYATNQNTEKSASPVIEILASPSEIFKQCALQFKQLHSACEILNKLLRTQSDPPKIAGLIFSQLKQIKLQLHTCDPVKLTKQITIVEKQLQEYQSWLQRLNDNLPPYTMRQYLDQGVLLPEEMLHLARFMIAVQSDSTDDKGKVELLLSRALELEVDRQLIISSLFVSELTSSELFSEDPNLSLIKGLLTELESVGNYYEIIESNLLARIKQTKQNLGISFWHPQILPVVIEINLKLDFRIKELMEQEQRELGMICDQLLRAGIKVIPRRGQAGSLDIEAARRMVERAKDLLNYNYENNRSNLMVLAEISRLLRAHIKDQNLLTTGNNSQSIYANVDKALPLNQINSSNLSFPPTAKPVTATLSSIPPTAASLPPTARPVTNLPPMAKPVASTNLPPTAKPVTNLPPMAKPVYPSQQSDLPTERRLFVSTPGISLSDSDVPIISATGRLMPTAEQQNFLQTPAIDQNQIEMKLQSRLAEICILLATKLRDLPVKVLQLKRSQLTVASWEVEALLSSDDEEAQAENKKQNMLMRRAIALLAEMQEVGVSCRELFTTGKVKEGQEALLAANYFLDQAKLVAADLETQSHRERDASNYAKAQNLAATRQKLVSTNQLLSTIISWLKRDQNKTNL